MLISEFFGWAERATAGERAEAAGALAKAYLYADLDPIDLGDAERGLATLLDDPSPLVRRALAEALATASDAPHHILVALTTDRADIAALVLERSPVLSDADLVDAAAIGEAQVQCAVARRASLSPAVSAALAEVGCAEAALVLCRNRGAAMSASAAGRLIARFGGDAQLRDALANRADLAPEVRHALVLSTASSLADFAERCGWMAPARARRVVAEAGERATATIGATLDDRRTIRGNLGFVGYLHRSGHLTPALLMRALLCGNLAFFEAALAELSGKAPERVSGLVRHAASLGFSALYRATGLPAEMFPAVRAALDALRHVEVELDGDRLDRGLIGRVLRASLMLETERGGGSIALLLRRFDAEAARAGYRDQRAGVMRERSLPVRPAVPQIGLANAA